MLGRRSTGEGAQRMTDDRIRNTSVTISKSEEDHSGSRITENSPLLVRPESQAGEGPVQRLAALHKATLPPKHANIHSLNQFLATAICGNDIAASILYASGLVIVPAGKWAPVSMLLVVLVLALYRNIYAEVGSALPFNGGAYTLLLNTAGKRVAAIASTLTLFTYVATAVLAGTSAMYYLRQLYPTVDIAWSTILVLLIFALLTLYGLKEGALSACVIFTIHILTLCIFVAATSVYAFNDLTMLKENWATEPPHGDYVALYFGFSVGLLGVTGFETSSNYIEEQKPGVFPKTLRNVTVLVAIFNPTICFLALCVLPMSKMVRVPDHLMSSIANRAQGAWLKTLVNVDAVMVLSGTVLTCFVGVQGLVKRMAMDHVLPAVLLNENSITHTPYLTIISFFFICASLTLLTTNCSTLGGVYTVAFVTVLLMYAAGNMLLKLRRDRIPRNTRASWPVVIIAFLAVFAGLVGYIIQRPEILWISALYLAFLIFFFVGPMLYATSLLRAARFICSRILPTNAALYCVAYFNERIRVLEDARVMYFWGHGQLDTLEQACRYVIDNERARVLIVVHVHLDDQSIPANIEQYFQLAVSKFPELRLQLALVKGTLDSELVYSLSQHFNVPSNFMFIGCPQVSAAYSHTQLGGLRIIHN